MLALGTLWSSQQPKGLLMEEPSPAWTCNTFHGSTWLREALPMMPKGKDTCSRLTTRSRHRSFEFGSRPTAHSRQSTSRITSITGLWPGAEDITVTSSKPLGHLVTAWTCGSNPRPW